MTAQMLVSQLHSLELQIAVPKAQIQQAVPAPPAKSAADLYGICAGLSETTEADLEAVKYRTKWDGPPVEGGSA
jgi:hypothetical protein